MTQTSLPSKRFIIRGVLATALVAVLLLAQTQTVRRLFSHSGISGTKTNAANIGEAVGKDSNFNGIPDWEEELFGLDPAADGATNKKIIAEKKAALSGADQPTTLTQTDIVARQLLAVSAAADTTTDSGAYARAGATIGNAVTLPIITNHYGLHDISTVPTTVASMNAYYRVFETALLKYPSNTEAIDLMVTDAQNGDFSNIDELHASGTAYRALAEKVKVIPVPVALTDAALEFINGLYGMADSFDLLQNINQNGVPALAGFAAYRTYGTLFQSGTAEMHKRFIQYGILSS